MLKPQPKKDDGVIHVVQGAAGTGSGSLRPAAPPARRAPVADTYDRRESDSFDAPHKRGAVKSASFADPFADSSPAPRARAVAAPAPRPAAPPPAPRTLSSAKREPAGPGPGWRDPFADAPSGGGKPAKRSAEPKREAPAGHPPGWKDPFSDAAPAPHAKHPVVAMRESHTAKASGWGLLKKQPRR